MKRTWTGKNISTLHLLDDSDIGQLLTYILGHYVRFISDNASAEAFLPMLEIYFEGSKVTLLCEKFSLYCTMFVRLF